MKIRNLAIVLFALVVFSCTQPAKEQENTTEEKPAAAVETPTISMKLINPNRATAEELAIIEQLDESLINSIVEARPFNSMLEINQILETALAEEIRVEVYKQMFLPMNLNTAEDAEMKLIPGVGDRMAHEFEEYRPYVKMAQFRKEIGKYVDDNEVSRLAKYVFVPVNLNTATDEEILAIPGVGNKMLHEFKEYRPYDSIEKFRREIGKYVSEEEVAMFERYVTIE